VPRALGLNPRRTGERKGRGPAPETCRPRAAQRWLNDQTSGGQTLLSQAPCTDFNIKLKRRAPLPPVRPFLWPRPVLRPNGGPRRASPCRNRNGGAAPLATLQPRRYGHFTTGGKDERIDSTLPPVFSPKMVPRS